MEKIIFIIDGYNFYFSLKRAGLSDCKWLDLAKLFKRYIKADQELMEIVYCTTITPVVEKQPRQRLYIRALLNTGLVRIVYGVHKLRTITCPVCGSEYQRWTEKKTDVNIAVELFDGAVSNHFDVAILVTADGDLIPALSAARRRFPDKQFGVAIPPDRVNRIGFDYPRGLVDSADFAIQLKSKMIRQSLFPREITLKSGKIITCPRKWE